MARTLADAFGAPLAASTVSRLLVDLNRSTGHPQLFSATTRRLPTAVREQIVARHYRPHRARVEALVADAVARGERVIHIASHSFTPTLDGVERIADVGLLYDPRRPGERDWCQRWQAALASFAPGLRVRRNYPYAGKADGLTSYLRRRYPPDAYVGIELEINQAFVIAERRRWATLQMVLIDSLRETRAGCAEPMPNLLPQSPALPRSPRTSPIARGEPTTPGES